MHDETNYWKRKSLSRRSVMRGAGIAGAGLTTAALVGCGDDDDGDSAPANDVTSGPPVQPTPIPTAVGEQPVRGGTLSMPASTQGDGSIFDPGIAIHGGTFSSVFSVYDALNYFDTNYKLTAGMADLPEQPDAQTLVYKIKPDVFWQNKAPLNGRQFTAEDAAFGLKRFTQNNPQFVFKDRFAIIDKYEVVDKQTLRLKLSGPFAPMVANIAEASTLMVSKDIADSAGDAAIASDITKAIGTGPFMVASRKQDTETVFERNPNYYRKGQPYIDGFKVLWLTDAAAKLAAFVSGQSDYATPCWTGSKVDAEAAEQQLGKDKVTLLGSPAASTSAIHFNTKVKPYDDPRVRTALHLATNRNDLISVGRGNVVFGGPIPAMMAPYGWTESELKKQPGYREGKDREQDLKDAKAMLSAAAVDLNNLPKFHVWTSSVTYGQVLQQNWQEIGFKVDIQEVGTADALSTRTSKNFAAIILGYAGAADPDMLYNDIHTKGGQNFSQFSNPEIDALLEKARTETNKDARKKIYDETQTKLLKEHNPRIWWAHGNNTIAFRSYIKGPRAVPNEVATNYVRAGLWRASK